jgi:type IV secretory pathway component VirB8
MLDKKKGGNMNTFDSYGDMEMLQMENQELDNRLKECKTEEEKQEVINEYISSRIFAVLVAIVIIILAIAIVGAIIYLFK